jgi:T-complex protein 1 subunit theta
VKLGAPHVDELGFAKSLRVIEIGGTQVILLEQDASAGAVSTVVLRASTEQLLDDLERAIDDGVNAYKVAALLL